MTTCLISRILLDKGTWDLQGSRTADGGLVKHNKQVGPGWVSSSTIGSDGRVGSGEGVVDRVSAESTSDSGSDSDSDSDSGTVTRSGRWRLVDIRL